MPGTGFGFPSYPQRPSVDPQTVGQMLMQQQAPMAAEGPAPTMIDPAAVGRQLSDVSADDTPVGGDATMPSALHIAAREATARGPAATAGTQRQPAAPGTYQQLLRMGVSQEELELLTLGGSIR